MVSIQVHSFLGMHRATSSEKNRRKRVFLTTGMGGPSSFGIWITLWSCSGSDYLHLMSWKHLETLGIARIPALAREYSHGQLLCSMGKSSTLGQNFHGYVSLLKAYCYWRIPNFSSIIIPISQINLLKHGLKDAAKAIAVSCRRTDVTR